MLTSDNDRPVVSVVVPCRNERSELPAFMASLQRQDWPPELMEVIVAEGMSDDGSRELLASYAGQDCRLRVIDNPGRIVSTGLNEAIRNSAGDVVIRMDVHAEYAADYIRRCVETLLATNASNVGGAQRARAVTFRSRLFGAAFNSLFAVGAARSHDVGYEGYVDTVWLGCWRKKTLEKLGLFDESLVRNQDDELNYRLTKCGGRIWQSRSIVCWYTPRTSIPRLWRQYFQYGFWKVAVIRKHGLPASVRHLVPAAFVLSHAVLACWAAVAAVSVSPTAAIRVLWLWTAIVAVYMSASLTASFLTARRNGWALLPFLPAIFAVYHAGYGSGFLTGLWHWSRSRNRRPVARAVFSELSR